MSALRWFASLVRPYAARLTVALLALILSGGVSLVLPYVAGNVVDVALVKKSLDDMKSLVLALLGLFAVSGALDFVEHWTLRSTAAELLASLRARLHGHLLTLTPAFFESQRVGDLLSRLDADVGEIGSALTSDIVNGLQQALLLVGTLAVLFTLHGRLTGVMLLAVPPVIAAAVLFGLRFEKLSKERQEAQADANVAAEESLAGIRTVQAFVREPEERERYRARIERAKRISLRAAALWGAFGGVVSFLAFSAVTLVLWYGGTLLVKGELRPGELTSFLIYTVMVASAVGSLTALYGSWKTAIGATQRVRELLDTKPVVVDAANALPLARVEGRIELRGVGFAYPAAAGKKALEDVSLAVEPGQCVALVGPSGAGKSTIVALLLRFHDSQEGSVLLDGEDVRRYRLADLRGAIGLVPQEILLFGGTVSENIRFGRPGASADEVRAAAEAAQAHAFIDKLPRKYDSVVGERGIKLSAGERQRIAIARVFLKDPRVVVLDEATSSLDSESEHLVQRAFDRLLEGRTTIVIAHRLTTVRRADKVVVVEAGRLHGEGTHEELLEKDALYRRLCELQLLTGSTTAASSGP